MQTPPVHLLPLYTRYITQFVSSSVQPFVRYFDSSLRLSTGNKEDLSYIDKINFAFFSLSQPVSCKYSGTCVSGHLRYVGG